MNTPIFTNQIIAYGYYLKSSPSKIQRILNQIRKKNYLEALFILEFLPYKICLAIWKILYSAAINAEQQFKIKKKHLIIDKIFVTKGSTVKSLNIRAKSKTDIIKKITSHLTIILKFVIK